MASSVWGPTPWEQNPWGTRLDQWWVAPGTFQSTLLEQQPQSAYQRFLDAIGLGRGQTLPERWYGQQYQDVYQRYLGSDAYLRDPTRYRFLDFLRDYGGNLARDYAQLSPRQRGENPGAYLARLRWIV